MPDSHCHAAETGPCAFLPVLEAGCPGAALTPVLHGLGSARWVAVNGWAENQLQASLCHGINSSAPVNIAVHLSPPHLSVAIQTTGDGKGVDIVVV